MMNSRSKKLYGFLILVLVFALAACNGQAEEPIDPDAIYTAAAITVEAQLTQAALQNPSPTNTEMPPTETMAAPTESIPLPNETVEQIQGTPGQPIATSTALVLSTFTASPLPPSSLPAYELLDQDPDDGSTIGQGVKFDMTWTIKNTGTETWNELYTIEFFLGDRIGGGHYTNNRYYFREPVAPGETTNVIVDMMTTTTGTGEFYSWWKLKDDMGNNFGDVTVTLNVKAPDPTQTPTP